MSTDFAEEVYLQKAYGHSTSEAWRIATALAIEAAGNAVLPRPPCPSWCTLPEGHPWDAMALKGGDDGQDVYTREHNGPLSGPSRKGGFSCSGWEDSDAPGVIRDHEVLLPEDDGILDAARMRAIAVAAASAAAWLEASQ
jgi:hypothetical protein